MIRELELDWGFVSKYLVKRIGDYIRAAGKDGAIVGLSGGIDSSLVLRLLKEATDNVFVLLMPSESTPKEDIEDSKEMLNVVGNPPHEEINIDDIVSTIVTKTGIRDRLIIGNIKARTRMTLLYAYAQKLNYLVVGTGDKSEILLGYFTKYGDGGVDILPIGDLYKSQVRRLSLYLNLPKRIIEKPSSPALWKGQTAEEELGISYEKADEILYYCFEKFMEPEAVSKLTGVDENTVKRIVKLVKMNEHKRRTPEIFKISERTVGSDWRYPRIWG